MRLNALARTLVGAAAVVGIAVGGLAAGGVGVAAATPISNPAANSSAVVQLASDNLGLTTAEAKSVQNFLISRKYKPGKVDGKLGPASWLAMQHYLHDFKYGYPGPYDGLVGSDTIKALQRRLADGFGYTGKIDGIAGSATKAAFKTFANNWT